MKRSDGNKLDTTQICYKFCSFIQIKVRRTHFDPKGSLGGSRWSYDHYKILIWSIGAD